MAITKIKTTSSFTNLTKYDSFLAGNAAYSPSSYESIASATGTGSSGTITFSSIPSTYQHLQIRGIMRSTAAGVGQDSLAIRANGDTSSVYSFHFLDNITAYNSASNSYIFTSYSNVPLAGHTANYTGSVVIDLHNYASTTQNKTFRFSSGLVIPASVLTESVGSGLYQSTSAVNSVSLFMTSGSWATTTQFALYGIKGA